jgi:uncharacterized protein YkwD
MRKSFLITLLLVIIAGAIFFYRNNFFSSLPKLESNSISEKIQEIQKEIFTPPPLVVEKENSGSFLTVKGIINITNQERQKNGLPLLKENSQLNQSAKIKADDMLKNQYFAHESLKGEGVSDLAKKTGYDYIVIGENLAMGNFKDDNDLVSAWMNSPGHRANILNSKYEEIGVAIVKGEFNGEQTWLAVQHFGRPIAACAEPDESIKAIIDSSGIRLSALEKELQQLSKEINSTSRWDSSYNSKVDQYNEMVREYNTLVSGTKYLIDKYNNQVKAFNACAGTD